MHPMGRGRSVVRPLIIVISLFMYTINPSITMQAAYVTEVINALGLAKAANTIIGTTTA